MAFTLEERMETEDFHKQLSLLTAGQLTAADWIFWWSENEENIRSHCNPGQYLRLKPKGANESPIRAASISQKEAIAILKKAGVSVSPSDRYHTEWLKEFQEYCDEEDKKAKEKAATYKSRINEMEQFAPRFGTNLRKCLVHIDEFAAGASEEEISWLEVALKIKLAPSIREFFKITKSLKFEGFSVSMDEVFTFDESHLCIGDYWRDADGDQILAGRNDENILYYSHSIPETEALAGNFRDFLNSISKEYFPD